ncbi:MAG: protein kinase [Candidatus Obscuribacterales bacterium]|nr:protein kinase [Candidatus Obscuribacterales bacterium]
MASSSDSIEGLQVNYCQICRCEYPASTERCPKDGCTLSSTLSYKPASFMLEGRYEIVAEIGRGGMGVIYKAYDHKTPDPQSEYGFTTVAIKVLVKETAENSVMRSRFLNEAKAASSLNHPNIVKVKEYAVSKDGLPYMVMQYLDGTPFDQIVDDSESMLSVLMLCLIDICAALDHAHRRHIVHRDIKPGNVMVLPKPQDESGRNFYAVLVDFGIAKIFTQPGQISLRLTQTGEVFGSPLYMSPEQCMGQKIDHRSDIYSMGCMLFECLAGRPPFEAESYIKVVFSHINDEPEFKPSNRIEARLFEIALKALAKEPDERYQSILEMKEDLERCYWSLEDFSAEVETLEKESLDEEARALEAHQKRMIDLLKRAEAGETEAKLDLVYFYSHSWCTSFDPAQAFKWCQSAANDGNLEAELDLAAFYENGFGVEASEPMAFYWYSAAALAGSALAEFIVGTRFLEGLGTEANLDSAWHWLNRACEHDSSEAQYYLGYKLLHGVDFAKDLDAGLYWLNRAAEMGNVDAQIELAYTHLHGSVEEPNLEQALFWMECAAEQGSKEARTSLGGWLAEGKAGLVDQDRALGLIKECADEGYPAALAWMGSFYLNGFHTLRKDYKKALRYFKEAAELDSPQAMLFLGNGYYDGTFSKVDHEAAFYWYKKGAELHDGDCCYAIACMCRDGYKKSESQDYEIWLREAADLGVVDAQMELGKFEMDNQNYEGAREWLGLACENGLEEACALLLELPQ